MPSIWKTFAVPFTVLVLFFSFQEGALGQTVYVSDTICNPQGPMPFWVDSTQGTNFYWEVKGGVITSGQGSPQVNVLWNGLAPWYIRVVAQNELGCWGDTLHTDIHISLDPVFKVNGPNLVCKGEEVVLYSATGSNFRWSTGDTTASIRFLANRDTSFYLIVDGACTTDTLYHHVKVYDQPIVSISQSADSVFVNEPVTFNASWNTGDIQWIIGEDTYDNYAQINKKFQYPGDHLVKVVVKNGNCYDTVYSSVYVWVDFQVHIPNAFTPNGDGVNELFVFKGFGIYKFEAMLLDRWGNLVYSWNDEIENGWNGILRGEPAPQDVYVYRIIAWDYYGKPHEFIGNFTLIR